MGNVGGGAGSDGDKMQNIACAGFFVPPFIGPSSIKKTIAEGARQTIINIETLAKNKEKEIKQEQGKEPDKLIPSEAK